METEEDASAGAVMAKAREVPGVGRRDWEDPMTVEWNKRHAHVPLHCHTDIEGERGWSC
jgi:hypothetical protein